MENQMYVMKEKPGPRTMLAWIRYELTEPAGVGTCEWAYGATEAPRELFVQRNLGPWTLLARLAELPSGVPGFRLAFDVRWNTARPLTPMGLISMSSEIVAANEEGGAEFSAAVANVQAWIETAQAKEWDFWTAEEIKAELEDGAREAAEHAAKTRKSLADILTRLDGEGRWPGGDVRAPEGEGSSTNGDEPAPL